MDFDGIQGIMLLCAYAISTTRIAGGLFVLLREQGLALTKKSESI